MFAEMDGLRLAALGAMIGGFFVLEGCGGSNPSPAATPAAPGGGVVSTAGSPSAGSPTDGTPSGTASGSPATPPGGGASGGSSDQGSGASTPPGSSASGAGQGGSVTPVATPPPDPCAGVAPTPGTPIEVALDLSNIPFCHLPTSDGSGTVVALGIGLHHMGFDLYPVAGGASVGTIRADHQDTGPIHDAFAPSAIGFHAATGTGVESVGDRGTFSAYDDHATLLTTSYGGSGTAGLTGDVRLMKPDPVGGGTALLTLSGPLMTPTYGVEIVDAGGHRTAGTVLDVAASDLSVATDGHVLVTAQASVDGTAWRARWLDHDARPLTDWFAFQLITKPPQYQLATYVVLEPLADGSIALREGDTWTLSFPSGATRADPAPAWLATRPGKDVSVVRGGKAMALTGAASIAACGSGDTFELVTPAGASCGTVQLTSASSCVHVSFGRDGTAFTLSIGASQTAGNQICTYRWWPALVR